MIEQKLELTEKELTEYKAKYSAKDSDFKEVNKELNKTRKELQNLTNESHLKDSEHADEIRTLKQEYEGKMKALREELNEAKSSSTNSNASPAPNNLSNEADKRF